MKNYNYKSKVNKNLLFLFTDSHASDKPVNKTNASNQSNVTYNYGCPYGQSGKYCDPCGVTSQPINLKIVGGIPANPHSYPAQVEFLANFNHKITSRQNKYFFLMRIFTKHKRFLIVYLQYINGSSSSRLNYL